MVKSVELTLGKEAATRVGELTLDSKAKVVSSTHPKVRRGWRVMAVGGKKVQRASDIQMALGMAQSRGKPYKVRFALPKVVKSLDGEEADEDVDDDEIIYEEIDEEEWEGEDGDELLWADIAKAEAERAREQAEAERARREAAQSLDPFGSSKPKKVLNPFAGKM